MEDRDSHQAALDGMIAGMKWGSIVGLAVLGVGLFYAALVGAAYLFFVYSPSP